MQGLRSAVLKSNLGLAAASIRAFSSATTFHVSQLSVTRTASPKTKEPNEKLVFGRSFTDHMLEVDWTVASGWGAPRIVPFHDLQIHPASSSLHYALQCFEGMKAYVDDQNRIRLFRPDMNMKRLNDSCARLALPVFDGQELVKCISELIKIEKDWIPKERGYSLYIRPTAISTDRTLGVGPAKAAKLYVILSPVGPYYKEGFNPVKLLADDVHSRAWVGGTGNYKLGANYGPTIMPQLKAMERGYSQVLWLYGREKYISEVGTMNFFVLWKNKQGQRELITAPLDDGTILPGVVRDSVLSLARKDFANEMVVSEKLYTIHDLLEAIEEKRVEECFGSGTAAIVSPVKGIHFAGKDYEVPIDPALNAGKFTKTVCDKIMDIQYGRVESPWSVIVK